jgi:hypothetical protein
MRATALAAISIALGVLPNASARAELPYAADLWRRVEALVQSFAGAGGAADREVIAPPAGIDPRMALVPPSHGTMRVIVPPGEAGRRP